MNLTFASIILLEAVFLGGTVLHVDYFNGSSYFWWDWRQLNYLRTAFYLSLPLIPYVYALFKTETVKDQIGAWKILPYFMAANFLFQFMGIASDPRSFDIIRAIVISRLATSYFYDAYYIKDIIVFLTNFHTLELCCHSLVHPPGHILFYYIIIQVFGTGAGVYIGGFSIALIASIGVIILYLFSSLWTKDPKTRLIICAFYALIPGLVLFFPQFDQVYPIFSMLMIYFWERSLRKSRHNAIYFGLILFISTFFAYNLLLIGAFHILSAIVFLSSNRNVSGRIWIVVSTSMIAIGTAVICFSILFLVTGFNPVLSFGHALEGQLRNETVMDRPYGLYFLYNFYEFFLGSGIIIIPLLISFVKRTVKDLKALEKHVSLSYIGFATILIVDLTGLVRGETTRLWLFLQPLILLPACLELIRLGKVHRWILFSLLWVNVVVIKSNMWFVRP
jgi:hypothetical protein